MSIELDLLTEIHTDMKYVKEKLQEHISDDKMYQAAEKDIKEKVLYPLWTKHQQDIGAEKQAADADNRQVNKFNFYNIAISVIISVLTAGGTVAAAYAAIKSMTLGVSH